MSPRKSKKPKKAISDRYRPNFLPKRLHQQISILADSAGKSADIKIYAIYANSAYQNVCKIFFLQHKNFFRGSNNFFGASKIQKQHFFNFL